MDVNSEVSDGVSEVWLWGVAGSGKRVLVVDRGFVDYFYAVTEDGLDAAAVAAEIEAEHYASVVKVEAAERRLFGKPVKTVKVYCRSPDDV